VGFADEGAGEGEVAVGYATGDGRNEGRSFGGSVGALMTAITALRLSMMGFPATVA
jgi:hypothetical protein